MERPVYFDNAATSFPKPSTVVHAVVHYMTQIGANAGRSSHFRAVEAGRLLFNVRNSLASMFGLDNPMNVILTENATGALSLAILGYLREGMHVITSSMEHNSVIRPLEHLRKQGTIRLDIVQCDTAGKLDPDDIRKSICNDTALVAINHASNVNGVVQPVAEIGAICREKGITFLVDASQSAGSYPINMKEMQIDLLAIPGHKALLGPTGTGALLIDDSFDPKRISPRKFGGTGSASSMIEQPDFLPDRFESGTPNLAGFAGLAAGLDYLQRFEGGIQRIHQHESELREYFVEKALQEGVEIYSDERNPATATVSFRIPNFSVSDVARRFSDDEGILCRQGLHCAPLAHRTLNTFPEGSLRFGFGLFNSYEEIDYAIDAIRRIRDAQ